VSYALSKEDRTRRGYQAAFANRSYAECFAVANGGEVTQVCGEFGSYPEKTKDMKKQWRANF
jgi:hypothetical protein